MHLHSFLTIFGLGVVNVIARSAQTPLASVPPPSSGPYTEFPPIRRVAVIGAGPSGLQSAATLLEHGFEVRLFDRQPKPGGNWFYTPLTPIPAAFPDKPIEFAAYTPDIPGDMPKVHIYEDGEDGISNEWRWREHWSPSPIWKDLHTNSAPVFTTMPDVKYPADAEWSLNNRYIQRQVRQFASYKGLNSNDEESGNVTSYSTRVERLRKSPDGKTWRLHLRKLEQLRYSRGRIRAEWWTEDFDAVVVATAAYDATHIPNIEGLAAWAQAFPHQIYHSSQYREPQALRGKNVLIVGGSVSASEIARDVAPYVKDFSISLRYHATYPSYSMRRSLNRLPPNISWIPEIRAFSELDADSADRGLASASLTLFNGSVIGGFDEIIFATGYRRSNPFLVDFHNSSIIGRDEPEVKAAPIITDGSHLRSLHWTGHYINDPTLAFTNVRAWTMGRFQSLGFAKAWSGKARLPSREQMWAEYPGAMLSLFSGEFGSLGEEARNRMWLVWLNNASLEFGGRLVSPWPIEYREAFVYYANTAWEAGYTTSRNFTEYENTPRDQWTTGPIHEVAPADEVACDWHWGCEEDW